MRICMAHPWKHRPVLPPSCLIGMDAATFWQLSARSRRKTLFNDVFFHRSNRKRQSGCLYRWHQDDFLIFFPFSLKTVFPSLDVLWMNIPLHHGLIHCNYAQPIEIQFHYEPVCKWAFAFTTVGYTAIILLWLCHVGFCACGCNSIYFCLSDFALCGSDKPICCRVAEIQIDFTSNLSSQPPHTDTLE